MVGRHVGEVTAAWLPSAPESTSNYIYRNERNLAYVRPLAARRTHEQAS